jgi:hypothetical protein
MKRLKKEEILKMIKSAGIQIQLSFENTLETNLIAGEGELEIKVDKMKQHLERIKDLPEYEILKPEIEEFRERSLKTWFSTCYKSSGGWKSIIILSFQRFSATHYFQNFAGNCRLTRFIVLKRKIIEQFGCIVGRVVHSC